MKERKKERKKEKRKKGRKKEKKQLRGCKERGSTQAKRKKDRL